MSQELVEVKPGLDRTALLSAGVASGFLSLLVTALLASVYLGSPWFLVRVAASLVLGPDVIPLSEPAGIGVIATGILVHLVLALIYAGIVALVIHRWGLIVGFVGGGLIGLALYLINFYALSIVFPWIFPLRNWIILLGYVAYGALAGTIYELLDEDDEDIF